MAKKTTITARDIVALLAVKHAGDVFVPECKNGPTHTASHLRMDAWAMARSWKHPKVVAYEVKISRSDFLQDDKWRGYLPYCNELYFVCPQKLIAPEELPGDIGLIVPSANCSRLYTKRKAVYRDIVIQEDVLRYVLICRAKIGGDTSHDKCDQSVRWADWLARRKYTEDLGYQVGRALREVISEQIKKVDEENTGLKEENNDLRGVRDLLKRLGFDGDHVPGSWSVERRVKQLQETVPTELKGSLCDAKREIEAMQEALAELESGKVPG